MRPLYHPNFEMDLIEVPSNIEQANENLERLAVASRRSFLTWGSAAAGTAAVLGSSSISEAQTTASRNPLPSLFTGSTAKYFRELQFDEVSHVNINSAAIRSLGGTVRPTPTFTGITNLTAGQLLNFAVTIANTGVGALFGAYPYISNPAVAAVSGSIALVEAYHAGFANSTANTTSLLPNNLTYAVPLTIQQVVSVVTPYIVSLNDPSGQFPATFSTTPSAQNDIAILNFAIIIDLLEATAYSNNVPRLFG